MSGQNERPDPFPVRKVGERDWEVLIRDTNTWLACQSEGDATAIAAAPVLRYESLGRIRSDAKFAGELEASAAALRKHNIGPLARFLERRAEETRKRLQGV